MQGRELTPNRNIIIENTSNTSALILSNIDTEQSGKYSILVMNEYGRDEAAVSVAVESVPEPPSGQPSISQGQDRVSIAWCRPSYDGGCMISGFV